MTIGRYASGTRVQHRNGYIFIKTPEGMKPEARAMWEATHGDLREGDRVFHLDGDRTNNNIRNLAKIHFNTTKFTMLKESRVLWKPTGKAKVMKNV